MQPELATALLTSLTIFYVWRRLTRRVSKLPPSQERVLVLGASSGVGKEFAIQYASRGAKVCVVGRREAQLHDVVNLCLNISHVSQQNHASKLVFGLTADFTNPEDMIRVRDAIQKEWSGLDTVLVCAGVSALRPILDLADVQAGSGASSVPENTPLEGLFNALSISNAAFKANYEGPLVSALVFIPFISRTSSFPAMMLMSSVAAIIPAPTRALYGASKSASLILYQALAIENPNVNFTVVLPGTIKGDFRASAVDKGAVRELNPNKRGLGPEYVARRCIRAVDNREKMVVLPFTMRLGQLIYWWIHEGIIEWFAMKKYNYPQSNNRLKFAAYVT